MEKLDIDKLKNDIGKYTERCGMSQEALTWWNSFLHELELSAVQPTTTPSWQLVSLSASQKAARTSCQHEMQVSSIPEQLEKVYEEHHTASAQVSYIVELNSHNYCQGWKFPIP